MCNYYYFLFLPWLVDGEIICINVCFPDVVIMQLMLRACLFISVNTRMCSDRSNNLVRIYYFKKYILGLIQSYKTNL